MTVMDLPRVAAPRVKRWTKREYNALVDRGFFQGQRLYLYRGELIEMPPMGGLHARAIMNISEWLYSNYRPEFRMRIQMPFETPGESMPEPDCGVFTNVQCEHMPHPIAAVLLIEVSDSSLDFDREKAADYAAAQVPEYWIVDVTSRSVEVFREPVADSSMALGYRYASHVVAGATETIASLVRPDAAVAVKSLVSLA